MSDWLLTVTAAVEAALCLSWTFPERLGDPQPASATEPTNEPGLGTWWSSGAGGVIEPAINPLTLAVGVGLLRWAWRRRNGLLKVGPAS